MFQNKYLITSDKEDLNNLAIILNIKTKNPTCISAVYFCHLETSEAEGGEEVSKQTATLNTL